MPETMPAVGEVRSANGETRRWNGHDWEPQRPSFLGTEDFPGRLKRYATGVVPTMAADLISPVVHPLDTLTGLGQTIAHPIEALQGLYGVGKAAVQGDPAAMGHVLATLAAPRTADVALSGTNALAHAVAENPATRSGMGYIGGAGTALVTGVGHPFIGAAAGRVVSPLLRYPAEELARATDWLKQAIHGSDATPPEPLPPHAPIIGSLSREESPEAFRARVQAKIDARGGTPTTVLEALKAPYEAIRQTQGQASADTWLTNRLAPSRPSSPSESSTPVRASTTTAATGESPEAFRARVQAKINATKATPTSSKATPTSSESSAKATAASLNDELARLRRTYGADRLGALFNPSAPEAGVGRVLEAAPGPSAMPDVAQQALLRDLQAGHTADPSRTLRALSQMLKEYKRNAGPAKSAPAQALADLLKKHGFDIGGP